MADISNDGSSVDVWAPTDLLVAAEPGWPDGRYFGGTSASSPFVAGVAAMVRAVAPALIASADSAGLDRPLNVEVVPILR